MCLVAEWLRECEQKKETRAQHFTGPVLLEWAKANKESAKVMVERAAAKRKRPELGVGTGV